MFPGAPIAVLTSQAEDIDIAIRDATALGAQRIAASDLEFAIDQLVEVAVRALSSGINDPHSAMSILDRLGATLCDAVPLHLATGVILRNGRPVLVRPSVDYNGLTNAMFYTIRQSAAGSPAVLIRMMEVLTVVAGCERDPIRLAALHRHAVLVLGDGERAISTPADLADLRERYEEISHSARKRTIGPRHMMIPFGFRCRGNSPTLNVRLLSLSSLPRSLTGNCGSCSKHILASIG